MMMRFLRIALLAAAAAAILPAGPAWATSCEGECQGVKCVGGCTINHPTCATSCTHDACPGKAVCKEHGGDNYMCVHEAVGTCRIDNSDQPPDGPEEPTLAIEVRDTEWSVVAYETDRLSTMPLAAANILATSNRFHAERSVDELVLRQHDASARLRQRVRTEGIRVDHASKRRLLYSVAPAGRCVRAELEMANRQFGPSVPANATVFVRATIDSNGGVVGAELLHSDKASGAERAMVDFLKQNAQLTRTDGQSGPFEVYIVLSSDASSTAGWITFAANVLL